MSLELFGACNHDILLIFMKKLVKMMTVALNLVSLLPYTRSVMLPYENSSSWNWDNSFESSTRILMNLFDPRAKTQHWNLKFYGNYFKLWDFNHTNWFPLWNALSSNISTDQILISLRWITQMVDSLQIIQLQFAKNICKCRIWWAGEFFVQTNSSRSR